MQLNSTVRQKHLMLGGRAQLSNSLRRNHRADYALRRGCPSGLVNSIVGINTGKGVRSLRERGRNIMKQPNVVLIVTDQHRLSAVGAYGETPCKTPSIDRLAQEGVLFRNAYTTCPVCSPSRATIMTGLYAHSHGVTSNLHSVGCSINEIEDRPTLLPRMLQAAGYSTGYTGKWHLGTDKTTAFQGSNKSSLPSTIGFEGQDFPGHGDDGRRYKLYQDWLAKKGLSHGLKPWAESTKKVFTSRLIGVLDLPTDATVPYYLVDNTIEMIEEFQERGKPFFVSLNFWGPHGPYFATQEFVDMYRDVDIPPWPNYEWDSRGTPGPHHYKIHWDRENLGWRDWATAVRTTTRVPA